MAASLNHIRRYLGDVKYKMTPPKILNDVLKDLDQLRLCPASQLKKENDPAMLELMSQERSYVPSQIRNRAIENLLTAYKEKWTFPGKKPHDYIFDVVDIMHNYSFVTSRMSLDVRGCLVAAEWVKNQEGSCCFLIARREFDNLLRKRPWPEGDNFVWESIIQNGHLLVIDVVEDWIIEVEGENELSYTNVVHAFKQCPDLLGIEARDLAMSITCGSLYGRSLRECLSLYKWSLLEKGGDWISNDCPVLAGNEKDFPKDQTHYFFIDGVTMGVCVDSGRQT